MRRNIEVGFKMVSEGGEWTSRKIACGDADVSALGPGGLCPRDVESGVTRAIGFMNGDRGNGTSDVFKTVKGIGSGDNEFTQTAARPKGNTHDGENGNIEGVR